MIRIILILLCGVCVASCVSKRKLTYLRSKSQPVAMEQHHVYKIRKGDNLYIEIKSPDPSTSNFYNLNSSEAGSFSDASVYLKSHSVNEFGEVTLPYLGAIKVEGMSIQEVTHAIEKALTGHLRDATVFVKLVSYEITILGEVNKPGTYVTYNNEVTIFQAIGLAGDLTNYGKRKRVKVIRNNQQGLPVTYKVDLTSNEVFASEGYHIYPHDVIYVEPMRIRPSEMNLRPIGVLLSAGALVLLILRTVY